jgi:hypothetical protein
MTNRVRVNAHYIYSPNFLDRCDTRTSLQDGEEVVVVNLHGCPKANAMGHCYVNRLDGSFAGLVHCNSLHTKKEYIEYLRERIVAYELTAAAAARQQAKEGAAAQGVICRCWACELMSLNPEETV